MHRNKDIHNMKNNYTEKELKFIKEIYPQYCDPYKYVPAIIEEKKRIIVFGDIHGDYKLAVDMFIKADLIKIENDVITWTGGDTYVVQVGDQIDRCRPVISMGITCDDKQTTENDEANDIKILELFNNLSLQADRCGGAVISLIGNHELLNVMGHMEYVSLKGIEQFEKYKDPKNPRMKFSDGLEARVHAFQPGNEYAKMLGCTRVPAVIIGSNLFAHAGIIDALIEEIKELRDVRELEKINVRIRSWLLGLLNQNYVEYIIKYSKNSMFWTRILGKLPAGISADDPRCSKNITNVIRLFNVGSIIVGHTPQSFMHNEDINSTCDNKIWRVDNGSSSAFNMFDPHYANTGKPHRNRRTQYLEIINDNEYYVCDGITCKRKN
jgi:hypothetical protein